MRGRSLPHFPQRAPPTSVHNKPARLAARRSALIKSSIFGALCPFTGVCYVNRWNWGIFLQQAPFGNTTYLGWIWSGFQVTVALSVCAWIIAFFVGSLFGILRTVPNRFLSTLGTCYVELFRNVPLIVQFFTWYLVIPELLPANIGTWFKSELDPNVQFFVSSMLCLGLFTAARVCEQVRAAIQSLPRGQKAAGLAMGLTLPQTYRYVLLPNAYRVIVPPMTSEMLNLVKNSAIASTIGLVDMAAQAGKLLDYSAHAYESFTAITLAYIGINAVIMLFMRLVEKKVQLPGNLGSK